MKYVLVILAAFFALATFCLALIFILSFIAWLKGGFNVVLPGLGLIVSAPAVLIALLILLIVAFALTALLARAIKRPLR